MSQWGCAIRGCRQVFEDLQSLLAHQLAEHDPHRCRVCGETVPAGFFAIRHAFENHTRAEYVRHYDADADDIRWRERIVDVVESRADLSKLETESPPEREPIRIEAVE